MKIHRYVLSAAIVMSLAACASAPKPPTVNGRHRAAINSASEVEAFAHTFFPPPPPTVTVTEARPQLPQSRVVSVHFPWNDARFRPTPRQVDELQDELRAGFVRVAVRGRTDGRRPSAGDEIIAARRAAAARDWLINAGVPAALITTNYASAADPVGGNNYSGGRARNRRVDIEIIRK